MTRKPPDKKKNNFFGEHLDIKPSFMQKPKSMEEVMSEAFSRAPSPTVEPPATVDNNSTVADSSSLSLTVLNNEVNPDQDLALASLSTGTSQSTGEFSATVAENTSLAFETPVRLMEEVSRLKRTSKELWQSFEPEKVNDYWWGYAQCWHWFEDEIVPHLDKDTRLALRRCYRKAFGNKGDGKFFIGQTALAQEIGLSKRRVQDIMEIFHQLGWICKVAHFNRGNRKGTEYEMRLSNSAQKIFYSEPKQ